MSPLPIPDNQQYYNTYSHDFPKFYISLFKISKCIVAHIDRYRCSEKDHSN